PKQIVHQAEALSAAVVEIETTYDRTLQALSNALDVRDSGTEGHARRVVEYMELVARGLGVAGDELAILRRGALLHDIGKVGVPDRILRKPAALSDAEWTTMKRHPDLGARIIGGIPFLERVAAIVRHHHERWDGTGYPDAIAGERIPLGARIFTVADSFDAMTSDRPYRSALTVDEARREVERCRGTQFDPQVVDAFLGEIARVKRGGQGRFAILRIDVVGLSKLDAAEAEAALLWFAGVLSRQTRGIDARARLGGDEFGIVLVGADSGTATRVVDRI